MFALAANMNHCLIVFFSRVILGCSSTIWSHFFLVQRYL